MASCHGVPNDDGKEKWHPVLRKFMGDIKSNGKNLDCRRHIPIPLHFRNEDFIKTTIGMKSFSEWRKDNWGIDECTLSDNWVSWSFMEHLREVASINIIVRGGDLFRWLEYISDEYSQLKFEVYCGDINKTWGYDMEHGYEAIKLQERRAYRFLEMSHDYFRTARYFQRLI